MATPDTIISIYEMLLSAKPAQQSKTEAGHRNILATWGFMLKNIPDDILIRAATMIAVEPENYMPGLGQIWHKAMGLMDEAPDQKDAWRIALRVARGNLSSKEIHPRIKECLTIMGTNWEESALGWKQKEFYATYSELGQKWREEQIPRLDSGTLNLTG